jgi:phosphoglycerate dehydrogenase-like enzyme
LTNAKDVYSITIAEDIITKILVLNRNVKKYVDQMTTGTWSGYKYEKEIYGSTVGFLGSGSLASAAALRLKAFDAKVICYRKSLEKSPIFDETYHDLDGLETLLKKSDYVVVTLPINADTYHLLDKKRIGMMKKDALLINVGRGEVIDQDALIDALEKGMIRGAGLDVTTPEPLPVDSKLWQMENVYITPHNAPSSPYMLDRLTALISENIDRYLKGERLNNIVTL